MNYKKEQKDKAIKLRDEIFRDPGGGIYKKKPRPFVLSQPELNLWPGIREDAIDYFKDNQIEWWDSRENPTGHLLSSQIACINHLYFLRQRPDLVTPILQRINAKIHHACFIDSGYVEFEKVGSEKLGKEEHLKRGIYCTSIDAFMVGEELSGKRVLILIEWKYTESYSSDSKSKGKSGKTRMEAYKDLLRHEASPITHKNIPDLYFEPFYQLMRQTLLGWEMVGRNEYGDEDYIHLHIIPTKNNKLKSTITSPGLLGNNIEEAWKSTIRDPNKYIVLDPKEFLEPIFKRVDSLSITSYLKKRYWDT